MNQLNSEQQSAVSLLGVPLLVLAGAGSGKTRVITYKVAYLIGECKIQPKNIVALTFTNKAAQEMRQRVIAHIGKKQVKGLNISTFHTFGWKIIKAEHKVLGFNKNITIFDRDDSLSLLQELTNSSDEYVDKLEFYLDCISKWKACLHIHLNY